MGQFSGLLFKDTRLMIYNYFFYITLFIVILFVIAINFIIPEDLNIEPTGYITFETEKTAADLPGAFQLDSHLIPVESRAQLYENMAANFNSIGMVVKNENEIEYILQGHENEKFKNLLALETKFLLGEYSENISITSRALTETTNTAPFNHLIIPIFLVTEPALLGLFLIATMVFSEKEEDTLRAYTVTPGSFTAFFISKEIVLIALGIMSLLICTIFTIGFDVHFGYLLLHTITGSLMGSGLGLLIASIFDNITKAMVWIIAVSILLTLPFVSYLVPHFAPTIIKIIPVYSMLFAFKEALFFSGNHALIWNTSALTLIIGIITFITARWMFTKSL